MEYAERRSLKSLRDKYKSFDESLVAKYIYQVLLGLTYFHEQSIINRDIKAANILIRNNIVKLSDSGISVQFSNEESQQFSSVCSTYWADPEVINNEPVNPRTDIWSLGITAIEIFQSTPPYYELNAMTAMYLISQNEMPPLPTSISPELKDFLEQCLTKNIQFRKSSSQLLDPEWFQIHVFGPTIFYFITFIKPSRFSSCSI
jgi:serine/threonine protein kinase